MSGHVDAKPSTCTERRDVDPTGISVKVSAQYPGRSACVPCATDIERCRDAHAEVIHGRPRLPSLQSMTEKRLRLRPYIRTLSEADASVPDGIRWTVPRSAERTQWCSDFYGLCRPRSDLFLPSRHDCLCNRWKLSFESLSSFYAMSQGFPRHCRPLVYQAGGERRGGKPVFIGPPGNQAGTPGHARAAPTLFARFYSPAQPRPHSCFVAPTTA